MTDIDTMEAGPQFDVVIAEEVMEWKLMWVVDPLGEEFNNWVNATGVGEYKPEEWTPSTDIAAAWEVVLQGTPFGSLCWSVHRFHSSAGTDHEWRAECGHIFADALTAPLAICRAALKAVRATKGERA